MVEAAPRPERPSRTAAFGRNFLRWVLLGAAPLACTATETLEFDLTPHLKEETKSYALLLTGFQGAPRFLAFDVTTENAFVRDVEGLDVAPTVRAFLYPYTVAELGLETTNPQKLVPTGRRLPSTQDIFESKVSEEVPSAFARIDPASIADELDSIRVEELGIDACSAKGGCYFDQEDTCSLPCERPPLPTAPADPEPPHLDAAPDCPSGWDLKDEYCIAIPQPAPDCDAKEALFPGTTSCAEVGAPCPVSGFSTHLPGTDIVYVDGAAPANGDGSAAHPFQTVQEGLATGGTTLALASGTYVFGSLPRTVHVIGACPENTEVRGRITASAPVRFENLSMVSASVGAPELQIEGSVLEDVALDVTRLEFRSSRASGGEWTLRGDSSLFWGDLQNVALRVTSGTLNTSDALLRQTRLSVATATATLQNLAMTDASSVEVARGKVSLGHVWGWNASLKVQSAGQLDWQEARIGPSLRTSVTDGLLSLDRVVWVNDDRALRAEGAPINDALTIVIQAANSGLSVRRSRIRNLNGRFAQIGDGSITVEDTEIFGDPAGAVGHADGAIETFGSSAYFSRVVIRHQPWRGLSLNRADNVGEVSLEDVTIEHTRPRLVARPLVWTSEGSSYVYNPHDHDATGLWIYGGAPVSLSRVRVEDSVGVGIYIDPSPTETPVRIHDVKVSGVAQLDSLVGERHLNMRGHGLYTYEGESVDLRRVVVEDSGSVGINFEYVREVTLEDVSVHRVLGSPAIAHVQFALGAGVRSVCSDRTTLERFDLSDLEINGVEQHSGALEVSQGRIDRAAFGVYAAVDRPEDNVRIEGTAHSNIGDEILVTAPPPVLCGSR